MSAILPAEKQPWIDHLRATATIAVVFLHVSAPLIYQFGKVDASWWWVANVFNSCVRSSVPLFFMVSGALLLPKEQELTVFLKKRFMRIIYPFLFWALIHIVMNLIMKIKTHEVRTLNDALENIGAKIASGVAFHYWYVFVIIGIYLFVPIIGKWARSSSKKELQYFLILWLTFTVLVLTPFSEFRYFNQLTYFFTGPIGYVVLGYYLTRFPFVSKKTKTNLILSITILLSWSITIVGSYWLSFTTGKSNQTLYSIFSPNVIVATICIFMLFQQSNIKNWIIDKTLNWVSNYSYGIYLSHVLVLTALTAIKLDCMFIHPVLGILITVLLCVSLSGLMVFLVRRLPFGKYISG